MSLDLIDWRPLKKSTLRGFATVKYGSLKIRDVMVHTSNGKSWAGMPSKPIMGADGVAHRSNDGKLKYVPIMEWSTREAADRFSEEVIAAVERDYPGATTT